MAFLWLVDWLTGQMVLVDVPVATGTPPTPSYFVPVFFNLIPQ